MWGGHSVCGGTQCVHSVCDTVCGGGAQCVGGEHNVCVWQQQLIEVQVCPFLLRETSSVRDAIFIDAYNGGTRLTRVQCMGLLPLLLPSLSPSYFTIAPFAQVLSCVNTSVSAIVMCEHISVRYCHV